MHRADRYMGAHLRESAIAGISRMQVVHLPTDLRILSNELLVFVGLQDLHLVVVYMYMLFEGEE